MRSNYPPRSYVLEAYTAGLATALGLFVFGFWFADGMGLVLRIARFGL